MEHVWSLWGPRCAAVDVVWFWLVIVMIRMMIGDGNGIGGWISNGGPIKVQQGWLVVKADTEQWQDGHHWRPHWSHPMIVLWKECDRAQTMTQNPSVPWTMLPMPAANNAQWRVSLYGSSHVCTNIWMLHWRVCGWMCQESLWLQRLVVILAQDIQKWLHTVPSPTSTIRNTVSQSWSPSENISYQRSVAWLLVMIVPDTYWKEDLDTICPLLVFHSSELEFMPSGNWFCVGVIFMHLAAPIQVNPYIAVFVPSVCRLVWKE